METLGSSSTKQICTKCGAEYDAKHISINGRDQDLSGRLCYKCRELKDRERVAAIEAARSHQIDDTRSMWRSLCGIPDKYRTASFDSFDSQRPGNVGKVKTICQEYADGFPINYLQYKKQNGAYPSKILLSTDVWGIGKCVSGDSSIVCADGRLKTIQEINKWKAYDAISLSRNTLEPNKVDSFYSDGVKYCKRVTTRRGRYITATNEHPLLTPDGWKAIGNLSVGDSIAVVSNLPIFGNLKQDSYKITLMAYLIGEGGLTQSYPIFTTTDDFARTEVFMAVELMGCRLKLLRDSKPFGNIRKAPSYGIYAKNGQTSKGNHIKNWLIDLGLWGKSARNKVIPEEVFEYTEDSLRLFLSRLFECDGCLEAHYRKGKSEPTKRNPGGKKRQNQYSVSYSSASKNMIYQVSHLLLRFGITGYIRCQRVYKGVEYYEWSTHGKKNVYNFLSKIRFDGRLSEKANRLMKELVSYKEEQAPIIFDAIKSIEPQLAQPVFDLTIESTGNFVANDIIVHNTHLAASICHRVLDRWNGERTVCPVLFISEPDIYRRIQATFNYTQEEKHTRESEEQIMWGLLYTPLLILDDVGKEQRTDTRFVQRKMFEIINGRYNNQRPIVLTTNKSAKELELYLGNNTDQASFNRLVEMCVSTKEGFHKMTGESYRLINQ